MFTGGRTSHRPEQESSEVSRAKPNPLLVQAAFVAEEWVDHALGQARDVDGKKDVAKKAQAEAEQKLKDTLFHLAEVEKSKKNVESTLVSFERQVVDSTATLKKAKTQLALAMAKVKQLQKQLETKDAEKVEAEQAAYDAGMTKPPRVWLPS
ncbi:hypothetical protein SO802_006966 [Lithocarpus litseifolius]|uniref:Uncharacterized protein n=1 Tax=Lithocarpus litseifolius TaxID=425828 RepID=A0AAW2DQL6_9ROSI